MIRRALAYHQVTAADLGAPLEAGLERLQRYADLRGWPRPEVFGESVPDGPRRGPELRRLRAAVDAEPAGVVVLAVDAWRLFDSLRDAALVAPRWLEAGVALVILEESLDTTREVDRQRLLSALKWMRAYESERHRQRSRAGTLLATARRGGWSHQKRAAVNLLEVRALWQDRGLSLNEVIAELRRRGCAVGKGTLLREIRSGVAAGTLDPAARRRAIDKRGGLRRGGRKRRS